MQRDNPSISVIVPVYNVERYLKKCLDSLLKQKLENIEIILVDDGSTDSSGAICDQFAGIDNRIRVIHRENGGLGFARNSGLEIANGEYVGFVDSDDFVAENMYSCLYENAKRYDADISYGLWKRFVNEDEIASSNEQGEECRVWEGEQAIHQYLLDRIGLPPHEKDDKIYGSNVWSGIFRRSILTEHNIKFVSERQFIAEDIIFDIDIIPHCRKIVHCDNQLYYYRYNPSSLTGVYKPDRFEKNVILFQEMKKRLLQFYSDDELFDSLSRYFLTFARVAIIQEINHVKNHGYMHARKKVSTICSNRDMRTILKKYSINELPFRLRIYCICEKMRFVDILMLMTYFNQIRKR